MKGQRTKAKGPKKRQAPSTKRKPLHTDLVADPRKSMCGSARLEELDWRNWWMDTSFNRLYLHVRHKNGETLHRVYCRRCDNPRLAMAAGHLVWLYP